MTSSAKRKVSVTLDADLVAAMEADSSTTLSAEVNSALRAEFTRRKRRQALADLLDRLADERGRLDTPEDEAEMHGICGCSAVSLKNRANCGSADATGARRRSDERIARSPDRVWYMPGDLVLG